MKVILYCASTVNGFIGTINGNSDWVSPEDVISFNTLCRQIGCVIIGYHTFEIFNELPPNEWPNSLGPHIVLTSKSSLNTSHPSVNIAHSPTSALDLASSLGFTSVVIAGGSHTFSSFMQESLIDELFIDIEPLAFGEGLPMFTPNNFETKLELINTKSLSPHTFQIHYQVKK